MVNDMRLTVLKAVLESGEVESWEYDQERDVFRAFYHSDDSGLLYTAFWAQEDDCGDTWWIMFQDIWEDGCIQTGVGRMGLIN